MPLLEPDPRPSITFLLLAGIPAFLCAATISFCVHQYAHLAAKKYACGPGENTSGSLVSFIETTDDNGDCPSAAFAGTSSTFFMALLSFGLFIHHPRNMFLASMAFVNAASRIPESCMVFCQLLLRRQTISPADESVALKLMHFKEPTVAIVILCFYTLTLLFLCVTVIHDVKTIPRKWLVALVLFILLTPLENLLWKLMAPFVS